MTNVHLTNPDNCAIAVFAREGGYVLVVGNIADDMIRGASACLEEDVEEAFPGKLERVESVLGSAPGRWDVHCYLGEIEHDQLMRFVREDLEGSEDQQVRH